MKVSAFFRNARSLVTAGALVLCLHGSATSAATPEKFVVSKLGGDTILNTKPDKLVATVQDCVKEEPKDSVGILQAALMGGRADTDALAPQVTVAALLGLGEKPDDKMVYDIVFAAVKAAPGVLLETVRAATKAAPQYAETIVKAAVKACPDPNAKILPVGQQLDPNGYSKDAADRKGGNGQSQDLLPVGEAIAHAAAQGDPSLSVQSLLDAATQAGVHDGGTTNSYTGSYFPPLVGSPGGSSTGGLPTPPVVSK